MKRALNVFLCGLLMGAADVVPGVSGGTVAFVIGIYEEMIDSIKSFWKCLDFLAPLVSGMLIMIGLTSRAILFLLHHEVYRTWLYSLFFGLIAASILFCVRQIPRWRLSHPFLFLLGALIAFQLTILKVEQDPKTEFEVIVGEKVISGVSLATLGAMKAKGIVDDDTPVFRDGFTYALQEVVEEMPLWRLDGYLVLCGAVAISAMLLPGISGCYMLVILGAYPIVIASIANLVAGDFYGLNVLLSVGVGVFIGAVLFARVISWLLKHYHDQTMAMLVGFMLGSMPAVWPYWHLKKVYDPLNLENGMLLEPVGPALPDWDSPVVLVGLALALTGFLLIAVMERLSSKRQPKPIIT